MLLDPGEVLVDVGGIHDQQEVFRREFPIDQQVVHDAAVRVAHHSVEDLSGFETADFIGEDPVHELLRLGSLDENLAHVGDIEHANLFTDGKMFNGDRVVLDRHHEARKGAHFGLERHMPVIEAGFLELGVVDVFRHTDIFG